MKRLIAASASAAALVFASATPAWAPVIVEFRVAGGAEISVDNPDFRTQVAVEGTVDVSVDNPDYRVDVSIDNPDYRVTVEDTVDPDDSR